MLFPLLHRKMTISLFRSRLRHLNTSYILVNWSLMYNLPGNYLTNICYAVLLRRTVNAAYYTKVCLLQVNHNI